MTTLFSKDSEAAAISQSVVSSNEIYGNNDTTKARFQDFVDSFKPREDDYVVGDELNDIEKANLNTSKQRLERKLKGRHLSMIAIGSSIGTGLFVGSGSALSSGGPAAVMIAWILIGTAVFVMTQSMGELTVAFPISGSFNTYASRFIDPAVGFAVAWNYFLQYLVLMPLELVAASITIQFWNTSVNPDAWVAIFYVVVICINFFGVRAYGETEFIFSLIKVIAVIGFIIVGIVLACGGGPTGHYNGDLYWHNPGAFAAGFKGLCSVFVTAAFSFAGIELCGLTAAEAENPRKSIPRATKQVFWRITLFYFVSLLIICFLVPYTNDRLLGSSSEDASASPFVIAIESGGIKVLPHIMNVVILISVVSVGSSSVYATSRTLVSLAEQGLAPKICGYIDRKGRPLVAIVITNVFGLLSFIAACGQQATVFDWMLAISGLSAIFTWMSICLAHIRFRRALYVQGRDTDELSFVALTGVYGSVYGVVLFFLVLMAQFWVGLFPIGSPASAENFFECYLAFCVLIACYAFHKLWKRNWILFIRAKDIDIDTGRRESDIEALKQELAEEQEVLKAKPLYYRIYAFWC